MSEAEELTKEEEERKAALMKEAQELLLKDQNVKEYAACFLTGQQLCGYASWQLMQSLFKLLVI